MIKGVHAMFYSSAADELRSFIRDKLGLFATDVGEGWLIFDLPDAELGIHPVDPVQGPQTGTTHISFYTDNIAETMAHLRAKGIEFTGEPHNEGFAMVTHMKVPGGFDVMLYQPHYVKQKAPAKAAAAAEEDRKPATKASRPKARKTKRPAPKAKAGKAKRKGAKKPARAKSRARR